MSNRPSISASLVPRQLIDHTEMLSARAPFSTWLRSRNAAFLCNLYSVLQLGIKVAAHYEQAVALEEHLDPVRIEVAINQPTCTPYSCF